MYRLYKSRNGPVRHVGMSTELASRLQQWTGQYEYFEYGYHSSEAAAFRSEATLYHRQDGKGYLDNERHPPQHHRQVSCPVCDIHSAI